METSGARVRPDPSRPDPDLDALVQRYGRLIQSIVRRICGARAALIGDDVEQRVIVNIWRQLDREQPIEHLGSYVYRAAVRETVRAIRQGLSGQVPLEMAEQRPPLTPRDDPHARLEAKETRALVQASIDRLAPDRRRAVRAHLAGFGVNEIMKMYGWPYQKARNLIARGMKDLRAQLRAQGIHG